MLSTVAQLAEVGAALSMDGLVAHICMGVEASSAHVTNEVSKLAMCNPSVLWQRLKGQLTSHEFLRVFNVAKTYAAQCIAMTENIDSETAYFSEIEQLHRSYKHRKNTLEFRDDDERARQARISSHLRTIGD